MTHMVTLPGVPGGVGLQRVGRVLVASGEPLAPVTAWPTLALAVIVLARSVGAVPCFAPVGAEFAAIVDQLGLLTVRLGSTPYIHLQDWPQSGRAGAGVREAINRAKRDGLVLGRVDVRSGKAGQSSDITAWSSEVDRLGAAWLGKRRASVPFQWIFRLQPLAFAEHKQYFEARQSGRLAGVIAVSPLRGRDCWYLEDIVRADDAPGSTGTALVAYTLTSLKLSGVRTATLGGIPLAQERGWDGGQVTLLERLAYRLRPVLAHLYSFRGLELFKRRFGPAHWENEYLTFPPGLGARFSVAKALLRLVLRGS